MTRWIRLFGNQYFGFWGLGLILFAVQEIPYMLMPLIRPETNPIMNMTETSAVLDRWEKVLGSLCIALMIFVVHQDAEWFCLSEGRDKIFFALALFLLLANFFGWTLYFTGHQSRLIMLLFIVAMPPLFYAAVGFWRKNILLSLFGIIFFAVHFLHVYGNLKQ